MKSLIVVLVAMFVLNGYHSWASSSSAKNAINKKWNQIYKWQKKQDKRFDSINREAERLLKKESLSSTSPKL